MILYNFDNNSAILTIKLKAGLDDQLSPELFFCYNRHKANLKQLILDCQAATFIDSSFIPCLVKLCDQARHSKFTIVFCNMNDTVLHDFRMLNLHKIFAPIYNAQNLSVWWQFSPLK